MAYTLILAMAPKSTTGTVRVVGIPEMHPALFAALSAWMAMPEAARELILEKVPKGGLEIVFNGSRKERLLPGDYKIGNVATIVMPGNVFLGLFSERRRRETVHSIQQELGRFLLGQDGQDAPAAKKEIEVCELLASWGLANQQDRDFMTLADVIRGKVDMDADLLFRSCFEDGERSVDYLRSLSKASERGANE